MKNIFDHLCKNCKSIVNKRCHLVELYIHPAYNSRDVYRTEEHVSKITNDKLDAEIAAAEKNMKKITVISNNVAVEFSCDICGCNWETARIPECLGLDNNRKSYVCETCGSKYAPELLKEIFDAEHVSQIWQR